ncbi:3-oxoacyl-[acyl-carrier-protein] reductase [Methanosarcina thermophila]|jgi:3-oxoacyl-[acyl-carrier protein] reductase|uniref:3-oxoacyl-(Acyl-carrier protein) reductase n=3 Tax=Methanosarcina thermophila TaxID=2210 RepID=A0A1I6Z3P1_METTE|nr:SDR family oxidoreductase [Methanosarcina thermophila]ALK06359.1 MAG: oxidoreductase [Methanosarcina sp. 795]AKB12016.1 3-oxoacyl-[acyl-carrier protein] reductase [Methanosarcina thermophila TM-1]AKB14791.1 3-oxoacyl-[acyl-carrier protein] reductase [Methanosarcina thermophila CHTI-55]NLU56410.1 SDR family oxidoreductase [Methanosarcina thermophila]SFT57322.1 3-oxoacyl-[acyl-carrier-protein] reductase [Methanosarcina thermophila]
MSLAGQTALVTGGSKGIGRAICLALAKEGANVVIAARNESEIEETMNKLKSMGSKAMAIQADIRSEEDVRRLISMTIDKCGRLDILINNAGVAHKKRLEETTLEEYDEIMDTNLKGVFLCTKYAIPYIRESKNGKIINISSVGGLHGLPEFSVYCASKFGVNGLTESIAAELEGEIKVYAVCPGAVDTDMYRSLFAERPPLKPEHIAEKVLELASPDSRVTSGKIIEIQAPPVPQL